MNALSQIPASRFLTATGQLLAGLLFIFWGALFIEHLSEWLLHRGGPWPPPGVRLARVLHFAMPVGLTLMLWRADVGTLATVVATVAFFSVIGMRTFPMMALLNLSPILFFGIARVAGRESLRPLAQ